jgi:hypothetical protein
MRVSERAEEIVANQWVAKYKLQTKKQWLMEMITLAERMAAEKMRIRCMELVKPNLELAQNMNLISLDEVLKK